MSDIRLNKTEIAVSEDKLQALLTIHAEPEEFPTEKELYSFIRENGVVHGLLDDEIKEVISEKMQVTNLCFALGNPPEPDREDMLDWHVSLKDNLKPVIDEKNRANFKKLRGYTHVHKGQHILTISPPENTVDGKNIYGEPLSYVDWQPEIVSGENTSLSEDGRTVVSDINGIATWENNQVMVSEVYHIEGNVDYSTGNVKYKGPIIIDGDVRSGFRVESTDSIFIGGTVGASYIYSQSGDITVTFGILGQSRAKLLAGGSLRCGFIQDATVSVKEDVLVDHYAINSLISAGRRVEVTTNEGLIRGGSVTAETGILARDVGSNRNLFTELKLRSHREQSIQKMIWELNKNRTELDQHHTTLTQRLAFLNILKKSKSMLSEEREIEIERLNQEIEKLTSKVREMDQEELDLQKKVSSETVNREISIFNQLHRNVRIDIGGKEFYVDEPQVGVKIFRFKDEIVVKAVADSPNVTLA